MPKKIKSAFERILFYSDEMQTQEISKLLATLVVQKKRWLGSFHPDSRVRIEALRSSGVAIGKDAFVSIGLVVLDNYKKMVTIGQRVALGNYVSLIAASAPNNSLLCKNPPIAKQCIKTLPITIEDDAWIGTGVIILPGVTIGEKAIIGAGSVVKDNVESCSIVAGVPSRIIRTFNNG